MASRKPIIASTDRTLPTRYEGQIEPNWYCRGWNAKRDKYCKARAGTRTDHSGRGRCHVHGGLKAGGGDKRVTTGQYSVAKRTTLAKLIAHERERSDPLDLSTELATLRAVFADYRAKHEAEDDGVDHDQATKLLDAIGRMVERIERIRSQNAVSRPELNRIIQEMWRSVDGRLDDAKVKAAIRDDWLRVAL